MIIKQSVIIRRAETRDFLEIAHLDREAWKLNEHSEFIPDGEHVWRIWVEHAIVFCAELDTQILGAILAFPSINQDYCVHKVFVKKSAHKNGIGSMLFKALLKEVDKLNITTFLTVDPDNRTAISLYEKWGYKDRGFVKGYYREEEDRYVLSREAVTIKKQRENQYGFCL